MRRLLLLAVLILLAGAAPARALDAPSKPTAIPVAQTAYVSWIGPSGATSYRLFRSSLLRTGDWSGETLAYEGSASVFVDAGRLPMTTYRYRARALNASEASALSPYGGVAIPPFTASSPWNLTASPTAAQLSSTQLADLGSAGLSATGIPPYQDCGVPVYYGIASDPTTTNVTLTTDWSPTGEWAWTGIPIPIPSGVTPEACADGHLSIVDVCRCRAFDFWNVDSVSSSGITTAIIAQMSLYGSGYKLDGDSSARGSGVPLADTAVRAEEVYYGIFHAIGLTLPGRAAADVQVPASHTDGSLDSSHLGYGDRICLRTTFAESGSVGRVNIIRALKQYGAFIVDQGGVTVELDAFSPNDPGGFYTLAGASGTSVSDIHGSDFVPCA